MRYHTPTRMEDALGLLATAAPLILAGGTDVYPACRDRPILRDTLDITRIAGLRGIARTADGWRFGATTTWADVASAGLPPAFDALRRAAATVGAVQIQNAGTVAGNLCNASPAADGVPPLLALDASVELASAAGRRSLRLADFITGVRRTALRPDELVAAVTVPDLTATAVSGFAKLGSRAHLVISIAMVAVVLVPGADGRVADARVAVGACSPVACRLAGLEHDLLGSAFEPEALAASVRREHFDPLSPIDDVRAPAGYRRNAVLELTRRLLASTAARAAR